MEYARKASALLVRLRKEMNGAVVGDMESRGLHYEKNYGVALPTIRQAAREHAPDHDFAKHLWQQPVRELKLAATAIAAPGAVTEEELKFWFAGATNSELAENLASFLLARTGHVLYILDTYADSDNPFTTYSALLTAVRGYSKELPAKKIIESIKKIKAYDPFTERAVALLLSRAADENEENLEAVLEYAKGLRDSGNECYRRIAEDIMI